MNSENARLYLPYVQALADGKTLEVRHGNIWRDTDKSVYFSDPPECYRVKPELIECYVSVYKGKTVGTAHNYESAANRVVDGRDGWRVVKMREVRDED